MLLYSINALPGKNLPLEVELSETLRLSIDPLNAQAGSVFFQTDDERLNLVAQYPDRLFEIKNLDRQLKIDQNFWRELFQSSNPLVVRNLSDGANLPEWLLPDGGQKVDSIAVAAVRTKEKIVGLLVMYSINNKSFGRDEKTLLLSVADQIGMVVEREILVRKSEATAVMEERHRLARELHDSITQMLYSQVLFAGAGLKLIESGDTIKLEDHLKKINQVALQALREMRLMVYELRPAEDFNAGLVSLIEARLDAVEKRTGIDAELVMQVGDELSPEVTEVVYKIIHEALNNSLKHYLTNLEKVYNLDVNLVLPGHRSLMNNHRRRIEELKEHHRNRLNEVIYALQGGKKSAFQVAPYLTWDISYKSWDLFPSQQKWFAFGETMAHLIFLEAEGKARVQKQGDKLLFSLV